MTNPPKRAAGAIRPLRILEAGENALFAFAVPQQTELCWTGSKPRGRAHLVLGPIRLVRMFRRLRRGEFDLLVLHAPVYAPWHPRSILTTLVAWNSRFPLGLFATFAWRCLAWFHDVPIAALDLGDSCQIYSHDTFLLDRCKAYFKRELPSDHWLAFCNRWYPVFPGQRWRGTQRHRRRIAKLRPISVGTPPFHEDIRSPAAPEKKTDVFFVGAVEANSTIRAVGVEELRALQAEGYVVDIPDERLPHAQYLQRMSQAWLAWSPAGLGWECHRHYEAPMVGTVPLISTPPIMRHRPLLDGEHCVLYRVEPGGLAEAVRNALADKPRLRQIAAAAREHVRKHHTSVALGEYVTVQVLGRRLDGSSIDPADQSSKDQSTKENKGIWNSNVGTGP